jgi:putative ABC transport system permease protein
MDTLLGDLRFALRLLWRHRAFTVVAACTLALGIGANTAVFSLVNAVLLRPLPYHQADRLAVIWEHRLDSERPTNVVSPANFLRWQERSRTFSRMAAIAESSATLTGAGEPEELSGQSVNANLFPLLGVRAAVGRTFVQDEDRPGHDAVVLLSDRLWRRRFNADPAIVGRGITLGGDSLTVVGVMPPGFSILSTTSEFWTPMAFSAEARTPRGRYMRVVGRLQDGVGLDAAQAEFDTIASSLRAELPDFDGRWGVRIVSLNEQLFGEIRPVLFVLFGSVAFVLLLACVNVANLSLNRGLGRERELGLRAALGAGRGRLVRQLLTEGVLLAAIGGGLAVLLAWWSLDWLLAAAAQLLALPRPAEQITVDGRVLAFAATLSLATVVLFALVPAISLSRMPIQNTLREGARAGQESRSHRHLRRALAAAQIALAFTLLVAAGLMIRSTGRLLAVDPGFRADHVLTMRVLLQQSKYEQPESRVAFFDRLVGELARLPGVVSAGVSSGMPFRGIPIGTGFSVEGKPFPGEANLPVADIRIIAGRYFETMRIPLVRGRFFEARDGEAGRGAAIVNEALAAQMFPNENALGQQLRVRLGAEGSIPARIVGVVGNVRHEALDRDVRPMIYLANRQMAFPLMGVVIRTAGSPAAMAAQALGEVRRLDPDLPVSQVDTMDEVLGDSIAQRRFVMMLLAVFAGVALLIASVGVYGVLAYTATQRIPEIGVRLALGAAPGELVRQFMMESLALVGAGLTAGVAVGVALSGVLGTLLYGVTPRDPLTFAAAAAILGAIATLAAFLPARRASRTDPVKALRLD